MLGLNGKVAGAVMAAALMAAPAGAEDVMVVYDASGSMWGQIKGVSKIEIARDVMGGLVEQWPADTNLGLIAYGHRREADCGDIETIIEPEPISPASFMDAVNAITPLGRTPLSAAVEQAAEVLVYRENPATVVLISDGLENCRADPCALASQLEERGIDFTTHVVGFDVATEEHEQLACIAENTGGIFAPASDAGELADALSEVQTVIEAAPEPEPEPEPQPVPQVEDVTVEAPDSVTVGAEFTVSWSPTLAERDFLTLVPADAEEGAYDDYFYTRDDTEGTLTAPADPGLYEVRYVFEETDETAGMAPLEVVEADVGITAPQSVVAGADFTVTWTGAINRNDLVTIVPADAGEGAYLDYVYVREDTEGTLTAPGEAGLYEVRYVLGEGERTMATAPVELTEPEVTVTAPETVTAGADFDLSWAGTVNGDDFVTIVPAGAEEGEYLDYIYVREDTQGTLTAPGEPGLYEVRYVLAENDATLASAPVELVVSEVSVSAPETVTAGADFNVSWTGTVNGSDFVTIVPAGADEGEYLDYVYVREDTEGTLTAPGESGLYEVRYVLDTNDATLASTPVELVEPAVSVSAPSTVIVGADFEVTWTGAVNGNDFVTIVPLGAAEGEYLDYLYVREAAEGILTAPGQPGLYEVRYVLDENDSTLAATPVELIEAEVTVSAPDSVIAGADFEVSWTGTINRNDFVTIVPAGAETGTYEDHIYVREATEGSLTASEQPGLYEVRYVLNEDDRTMASTEIEVLPEGSTLDFGAGLSVPQTASPGGSITVTWTADIEGARITLARPDQPDFTWIDAQPASDEKTAEFTLPDTPGAYEIRFLDVPNTQVLARAPVTAE